MRAETKKVEKNKSRPQRGGGFSLNLDCLVIRGDLVCVISQGISRCIVTSCPVSCDITTYGISRYHIYIPNFWDGYGDIVVDLFLDIEHYLLPARCTKHGAPRVESKRNGYLAIELQKQWYLLETCVSIYLRIIYVCIWVVRNRYQALQHVCLAWIICSCETSSTGIMRQSGACVASIFPPLGIVFDPYTHDNN